MRDQLDDPWWQLGQDGVIDLGHEHRLRFSQWSPDRELNPQYEGIPDVKYFGATVRHLTPEGKVCIGGITFDGEVQRRLNRGPFWTLVSLDPLTVTPSLLCRLCGDHGFITNGQWVA